MKTDGPIFSSPALHTTDNSVLYIRSDSTTNMTAEDTGHGLSVDLESCRNDAKQINKMDTPEKLYRMDTEHTNHKLNSPEDALDTSGDTENTEVGDFLKEAIVVGSHDGYLYCVAMETGNLIWKFKCDSQVFSSPFCCQVNVNNLTECTDTMDDLEYVENVENEVNCYLEEVTCNKNDVNNLGKITPGENNVPNNRYADSMDSCLIKNSLDNGDDSSQTTAKLDLTLENDIEQNAKVNKLPVVCQDVSAVMREPGFALDVVVCACTSGKLYILNQLTGDCICEKQLDGEIFSSPVVVGHRVYVGCRNDYLYCLKLTKFRHNTAAH